MFYNNLLVHLFGSERFPFLLCILGERNFTNIIITRQNMTVREDGINLQVVIKKHSPMKFCRNLKFEKISDLILMPVKKT